MGNLLAPKAKKRQESPQAKMPNQRSPNLSICLGNKLV